MDRVRFPDGSEGEMEVVRHPGAAAVVPVRTSGDGGPSVVLLRQYRYAAGGHIWEIPAGTLEGDEEPISCARRELEEEAGMRAGGMRRLTSILTTPGFADERIHLFLATELEPAPASHEDREFIERRDVPADRALAMVEAGRVEDAKSVAGLLYAARFAEELAG